MTQIEVNFSDGYSEYISDKYEERKRNIVLVNDGACIEKYEIKRGR